MDGYFLFDFGASSVLQFRIKEFPDLRFGVWRTSKLELFAQFNCYIDKFKPSDSSYTWNSIDEMLDFIHNLITSDYQTRLQELLDKCYHPGYNLEEYYEDKVEAEFGDTHSRFTREEWSKRYEAFRKLKKELVSDPSNYTVLFEYNKTFHRVFGFFWVLSSNNDDWEIEINTRYEQYDIEIKKLDTAGMRFMLGEYVYKSHFRDRQGKIIFKNI